MIEEELLINDGVIVVLVHLGLYLLKEGIDMRVDNIF